MDQWTNYYDQLRAIDIEELVKQFCDVKNHRCLCPFHDDHHPSMALFPKTQTWRCMACGKGGSTIDFVMEHEMLDFKGACEWLSNKYGVEKPRAEAQRSQSSSKKKTSKLKQQMNHIVQLMNKQNYSHRNQSVILSEVVIEPKGRLPLQEGSHALGSQIVTFEYSIAQAFCSFDNSFCQCMRELFDEEVVERITSEYLLGQYEYKGHDDCVIFPSIDRNFEVRDFKIQWYYAERNNPRFFHCDKDVIAWWSGLAGVKEKIPVGMRTDKDCLFGEHLLTKYPDRMVVLVESPKNACIGSAICPEYVWVATGNKTQMKPTVLEALRDRDVLVIPDRDAITEWKQVISGLGSLANFHMSKMIEVLMQGSDEKCDIADFIISRAEAQRTQRFFNNAQSVILSGT